MDDEIDLRANSSNKLKLDLSFLEYESFLGLGFESVFVAVVAGVLFGFLVGAYPLFALMLPFLPKTNLFLFMAYGVPITGSTHYSPKLGLLSITTIMISTRASQMILGLAPAKEEFFIIAGMWSAVLIFLIGYLPGKIIPTSENFGYLFKGLIKITALYAVAEHIIWALSRGVLLPTEEILVFPYHSIPLILIVSSITAFTFINTFCPYVMIPFIKKTVGGKRDCGAGNFVFKMEKEINVTDVKIKKASEKGFKFVSRLPSVTVFSCPLGGMISVYNSGDILIRRATKGQAERMNRHLIKIFSEKP